MARAELSTRWQEHAICKGMLDLFYSENYEDQDRAKGICNRCEVWKPCLAYATLNREKEGVWGGTTYEERNRMIIMSSALLIDLDARQMEILQGVTARPVEVVKPLFEFKVQLFDFRIAI